MTQLFMIFLMGNVSQMESVGETKPSLVFNCRSDNDLYNALTSNGERCLRYDTPDEAVKQAPDGSGVLLMADDYPEKTTPVDESLLDKAVRKNLRLYVEYPASLPNLQGETPRSTLWERGVVASGAFSPSLKRLQILAIHDCHFVPMEATNPHIVIARVAGLNNAVYGLPEQVCPILFEHPQAEIMVATTKLSQFVTARYAPTDAWKHIWRVILSWLAPGKQIPQLKWQPTVRPSYGCEDELPNDLELQAFRRGSEWFQNSRLLVHHSYKDEVVRRQQNYRDGVAPTPDGPVGDGKDGLLEGYNSCIHHDGRQPVRYYLRNDCNGESAGALAFAGVINQDVESRNIAANLNDFIYSHSVFAQGPRSNPESPSFGLLSWSANPPADGIYYGDDNARSILGTIASAALLKSERWDEGILRCLLANLRTSGIYGFRNNSLREAQLQQNGWRYYYEQPNIIYAPHYESYLWACFLWAYRATGYKLFLERAKTAIRMTMEVYPDDWRWTNGIAQERARMLLPLAWLVQVEETPEHRRWLLNMGEEVIARQAPCGALREELGGPGRGAYGPPKSNEDYGKSEATLLHQNGDPICDLLYTTNFAFLGLHEAAAATGESMFIEAEDKLAQFLCRIQIHSEKHLELNGAWFRGFDFSRWEYWGSNADAGWGVWSIESGWTQGWIVSVLGMRHMQTSLWDLTADSRIERHFNQFHELFELD